MRTHAPHTYITRAPPHDRPLEVITSANSRATVSSVSAGLRQPADTTPSRRVLSARRLLLAMAMADGVDASDTAKKDLTAERTLALRKAARCSRPCWYLFVKTETFINVGIRIAIFF